MTDEIRVFHLITRFANGGAEKTTEYTLDSLKESDTEYDLRLGFGVEYDQENVRRIEEKGITTICFRSIRHYNPFSSLIAIFAVALYLRHEQIDILHTHSTEAGIIGRIASWLAGTPIVIHEVHGDPITEDRNKVLNIGIKYLEKAAGWMSTRIIVKSEIIRESYLRRGIGTRDQYELIYHGVQLDRFHKPKKVNINNYRSELIALFVGRLEAGKGLFDLLEASERLNSQLSIPVQVLIAGDGDLQTELMKEIEERNLDNVKIIGYRDDIPQLMAAADLFVLPSYREGTPRVITEALASGLPVISTNIAGIPEQVDQEEVGILVSPGDVDSLFNAMKTLASDKELRDKMAEKADNDLEKFSRENSRNEYLELYVKMIERLSSEE